MGGCVGVDVCAWCHMGGWGCTHGVIWMCVLCV